MKSIGFLVIFTTLFWVHADQKVVEIPGYGSVSYTDSKGNMNEYLDKVLEESTVNFEEYNIDPMLLPDYEHNIKHKVLFVTLYGGVKTSNGVVTGLKSLHRARDATLKVDDNSHVMQLDGSLATNNLHVSANVNAWYSFLKVNIKATGSVSYVRASIELELPLQEPDFKPKTTNLIVNEINDFKINVSGLGPLNWLAGKIVQLYIGDVTRYINQNFALTAMDAINAQLERITLPEIVP